MQLQSKALLREWKISSLAHTVELIVNLFMSTETQSVATSACQHCYNVGTDKLYLFIFCTWAIIKAKYTTKSRRMADIQMWLKEQQLIGRPWLKTIFKITSWNDTSF